MPGPPPERHLVVGRPGELVQFDCFCIGRLSGTKGTVWQYTATDVYSAYTWAELHATARNPLARYTSELARRVPGIWRAGMAAGGDDDGQRLGVPQLGLSDHPGPPGRPAPLHPRRRPQTNGCVERVQRTILDECWKPAFARYLIPKQTGLARELERFLRDDNTNRAHNGRHTQGRVPDAVLGKAKMFAG